MRPLVRSDHWTPRRTTTSPALAPQRQRTAYASTVVRAVAGGDAAMRADAHASSAADKGGVDGAAAHRSQGASHKRSRAEDAPVSATRILPFISKLMAMLELQGEPSIHWGDGGRTFWLADPVRLEAAVLPLYFKHNRMAFFVKQLRAYGFKQRIGLKSCIDSAKEWYHEPGHFHRQATLWDLRRVQRAGTALSSSSSAGVSPTAPSAGDESSRHRHSSGRSSGRSSGSNGRDAGCGDGGDGSSGGDGGDGSSGGDGGDGSSGGDGGDGSGGDTGRGDSPTEGRSGSSDRQSNSEEAGSSSHGPASSKGSSSSKGGRSGSSRGVSSRADSGSWTHSDEAETTGEGSSDGDGGDSGSGELGGGRPPRSAEGTSLGNSSSSSGHSRSRGTSNGNSNDGSPNDNSNDGDSDESSSAGYTELQAELLQINASIVAHRKTMKQHRQEMMSQIEGILAHLKKKDHPIHGGSSPRKSASPPQNQSPVEEENPYLVRRPRGSAQGSEEMAS